MPPARSAAARSAAIAERAARGPRPERRKQRRLVVLPGLYQVRWDRVGRIVLLCVLVVVGGLYVEHTLSFFHTRAQAAQQASIVSRYERQNRRLERTEKSLSQPATIAAAARKLGMVRIGEHPYAVTPQR